MLMMPPGLLTMPLWANVDASGPLSMPLWINVDDDAALCSLVMPLGHCRRLSRLMLTMPLWANVDDAFGPMLMPLGYCRCG
jgi:hypothetical protein